MTLTMQEVEEMVAAIQRQEGVFLGRENGNRTAWLLEWRGRRVKAVYHSGQKAILTVMPEHMTTRAERKKAT